MAVHEREEWRFRFLKTEGCNLMRCSCGIAMCYICRKVVENNYKHFYGEIAYVTVFFMTWNSSNISTYDLTKKWNILLKAHPKLKHHAFLQLSLRAHCYSLRWNFQLIKDFWRKHLQRIGYACKEASCSWTSIRFMNAQGKEHLRLLIYVPCGAMK